MFSLLVAGNSNIFIKRHFKMSDRRRAKFPRLQPSVVTDIDTDSDVELDRLVPGYPFYLEQEDPLPIPVNVHEYQEELGAEEQVEPPPEQDVRALEQDGEGLRQDEDVITEEHVHTDEDQENSSEVSEDVQERQEDDRENHEDVQERQEDGRESHEDIPERHDDDRNSHEDVQEQHADVPERREDDLDVESMDLESVDSLEPIHDEVDLHHVDDEADLDHVDDEADLDHVDDEAVLDHVDDEAVDEVLPNLENYLFPYNDEDEEEDEDLEEEEEGDQIHGSDEEYHDEDDYDVILTHLSKEWLKIELNHQVSKVATQTFWELGKKWFHRMFLAKQSQNISKKTPSFVHIRRKMNLNYVPPITLELAYQDKRTGEFSVVEESITPRARFPPHEYTKVWEIAHVQVTLRK